MLISNKNINGGDLTLKDTRVSVWSLMQAVGRGMSFKEIAARLNKTNSREKKFTTFEVGEIIKYFSNNYM